MLTAFVNLEIFLEAVFLWKIPLDVALLISEIATVKAALAASLSPAVIAVSTFLTKVLILVLIILNIAEKPQNTWPVHFLKTLNVPE